MFSTESNFMSLPTLLEPHFVLVFNPQHLSTSFLPLLRCTPPHFVVAVTSHPVLVGAGLSISVLSMRDKARIRNLHVVTCSVHVCSVETNRIVCHELLRPLLSAVTLAVGFFFLLSLSNW